MQKAELICANLPEITSKKVLVRTFFSGISRGTESLVFNGLVPESEGQNMRCPHQVGEFSFPLSYGYACVGEVIATGQDVTSVQAGDRVFVLHPHQDLFVVDESMCNSLPKTLPAQRGVLCANMETALNGVWDGEVEASENFAVIGAGVVGLLTGFVLKALTGITPVMIDIDDDKQNVAAALGLHFKTVEQVMADGIIPMQRIFNTSSSGAGLQMAIDMADFEARIIEMSWFGDKEASLKLGGSFHSKRLQIISSQVGHVAAPKRSTCTHADRMAEVIKLFDHDELDHLLEPAIAFEDLPDKLHDIFNEKSGALCQLVQYRSQ